MTDLSDLYGGGPHTITSHSDVTDATGAELEELTGGGETTLHDHAGGGVLIESIIEAMEAATCWVGEINGVTNPAKINGIAVANIASVNEI